jgi:HTH-type transcriptional regulator/antitoxin HigA
MNKQQLDNEKALISKPGDTILETLDHLGMTQTELALRLGKTPSKVHDIISGKEAITVATALQLEKVFGVEAQFWLTREAKYRERLSRIMQFEIFEQSSSWLTSQPVKELKKYGYINDEKKGGELVEEILKFYAVANTDQWKSVYVNQYVSVLFRKTFAFEEKLGSMAAWLRIGEIEMRRKKVNTFNKDVFKRVLISVRELVCNHPEDFAENLQLQCGEAGVALVYTICISKAPISGAVRWIGGNPLIQMTDRYKSNDHFWFTFYHEAGHVLLHGRKDVFIEDSDLTSQNAEKEDQANNFANKTLLPKDVTHELPAEIKESDIRLIAKRNKTHPAIVLGRLQHLKLVPYSSFNNLKIKVSLESVFNNN